MCSLWLSAWKITSFVKSESHNSLAARIKPRAAGNNRSRRSVSIVPFFRVPSLDEAAYSAAYKNNNCETGAPHSFPIPATVRLWHVQTYPGLLSTCLRSFGCQRCSFGTMTDRRPTVRHSSFLLTQEFTVVGFSELVSCNKSQGRSPQNCLLLMCDKQLV